MLTGVYPFNFTTIFHDHHQPCLTLSSSFFFRRKRNENFSHFHILLTQPKFFYPWLFHCFLASSFSLPLFLSFFSISLLHFEKKRMREKEREKRKERHDLQFDFIAFFMDCKLNESGRWVKNQKMRDTFHSLFFFLSFSSSSLHSLFFHRFLLPSFLSLSLRWKNGKKIPFSFTGWW